VRVAALASLLCLLLPLAACGDDDDAGKVLEGSNYAVTVPGGWDDQTDVGQEFEIAGVSPEVTLADKPADGFATNVNIVRQDAPNIGLDEQTRIERDQLLDGAQDIDPRLRAALNLSPVERTTLGGRDARVHTFELPQGGRMLRARQVFARNGGSTYVVTYTALSERYEEDLDSFQAILGSWEWR
jgi:hypothetical protein